LKPPKIGDFKRENERIYGLNERIYGLNERIYGLNERIYGLNESLTKILSFVIMIEKLKDYQNERDD